MNGSKMLKFVSGLCLLGLIVWIPSKKAIAGESFSDVEKRLKEDFNAQNSGIDAEWDAVENEQRAEWAQLRRDVERKWQRFVGSTQKAWVDYDKQLDTRSIVDFEKGEIEIEAIVLDDSAGLDDAQEKIFSQLEEIFIWDVRKDEPVLKKQIRDQKGEVVTAKTLNTFFEEYLASKVHPEPGSYKSADGVRRHKYSLKVSMVPDHLDIRARRFVPLVKKNAERFGLEPELLMAMIHTESYFNPMAVSHAGAMGLMQVIPRHAGREAYRYLYGNDWVIRPEYLYASGINIELGSAYLNLLRTRHFSTISDPTKKRYLCICGYNWGPTSVRKHVLDQYPVSTMSASTLFSLLKEKSPRETSDYLVKVTSRIPIYSGYF